MKALYTLKRFENISNAHIQLDLNKTKSYLCKFEETNKVMEKSSLPMDIGKMRTIAAKSANAGAEICGICVGKLYANAD
ncbi:hypothetical protein EHQ58_10760 [Leptospira ognonensis]|uniref:Uncharacterized protein n=1 Tax=Leptospira ognonensis TaxID=2484945 RepID=A0A4R9JXG7_9LEPT|nr:hypothetical protein [Leptospira ognonensis]TGL57880.1 hypothetical protein EHQ58_10760 [Leptospira ognonensis]